MLDAVDLYAFEKALPSGEPARRTSELASEQQIVADPPGAADRRRQRTSVEVKLVGTFERADVVVVLAQHVGGPAEQLQLRGRKRRSLVRGAQRVVSLCPRARAVGRPTSLDIVARVRHRVIIALPADDFFCVGSDGVVAPVRRRSYPYSAPSARSG